MAESEPQNHKNKSGPFDGNKILASQKKVGALASYWCGLRMSTQKIQDSSTLTQSLAPLVGWGEVHPRNRTTCRQTELHDIGAKDGSFGRRQLSLS